MKLEVELYKSYVMDRTPKVTSTTWALKYLFQSTTTVYTRISNSKIHIGSDRPRSQTTTVRTAELDTDPNQDWLTLKSQHCAT